MFDVGIVAEPSNDSTGLAFSLLLALGFLFVLLLRDSVSCSSLNCNPLLLMEDCWFDGIMWGRKVFSDLLITRQSFSGSVTQGCVPQKCLRSGPQGAEHSQAIFFMPSPLLTVAFFFPLVWQEGWSSLDGAEVSSPNKNKVSELAFVCGRIWEGSGWLVLPPPARSCWELSQILLWKLGGDPRGKAWENAGVPLRLRELLSLCEIIWIVIKCSCSRLASDAFFSR